MKTIILLASLMISSVTFAQEKSVINFTEFKKEMGNLDQFNEYSLGEVEDLGGECYITIVPVENGFSQFQFHIDNVVRFTVLIEESGLVKRSIQVTDDGSYSAEYTWGGYASLYLVHADDAYDTMTLSNSSTMLTCGAYY